MTKRTREQKAPDRDRLSQSTSMFFQARSRNFKESDHHTRKITVVDEVLPTHFIIVPYVSKLQDEKVIEQRRDLLSHAYSLEDRLRKHFNREVLVFEMPIDDESFQFNLKKAKYRKLRTIYIIGHCNGVTFGTRLTGLVDLSPPKMADWLDKSGLVSAGLKIKLMGCNTATKHPLLSNFSFADLTAAALAEKGYAEKNIIVRGYPGATFESSTSSHSLCRIIDTAETADKVNESLIDKTTLPVEHAGKAAIDFRV